jgi:hypothetical protein
MDMEASGHSLISGTFPEFAAAADENHEKLRYKVSVWRPISEASASNRYQLMHLKVKVILRPTVSRPVRPGVRNPSGTGDKFFPFSL